MLVSTERAARSVQTAFHAARRAEGQSAWRTPNVFAWDSWVRDRWMESSASELMLLNALQEQTLWLRIIHESRTGLELLHPGRLAAAAQQAYQLLANYSPKTLAGSTRPQWLGDPAMFAEWLREFEKRCRREGVISTSLATQQLAEALQEVPEPSGRPPLLLIGFDHLLESQKTLLDSWGPWHLDQPEPSDRQSHQYFAASDSVAEVATCVRWLRARLKENPDAQLIVVSTDLQARRGELERALLDRPATNGSENAAPDLDFEFSLGVPLAQTSIARSALLLMRWLFEPLSEHEIDWLITSGHCTASQNEEIALAEAMYKLRERGMERPQWSIDDLVDFQLGGKSQAAFPTTFTARLLAARRQLQQTKQSQSPLDWVNLTHRLLESAGWPGHRSISSIAFQTQRRWETVLDTCGSLGFDGTMMDWEEFVSATATALTSTIFAPESTGARIQIMGPFESAGQMADGIWFLGAHDESWPSRGTPNALLPIALQRETAMPHASPLSDWSLANEVTQRLINSADEVIFSYSRHADGIEARPSRLVMQHLGNPTALATDDCATRAPLTEAFEDSSRIPFPHLAVSGGSTPLTNQSMCPFRAFGITRLATFEWEPAEAGLSARQRGQLLHDVLNRVWSGGNRGGISSLEELQQLADLSGFVGTIVRNVIESGANSRRRNSFLSRFPKRYLELEAERLMRLVSEWLAYERERLPFAIEGTEIKSEVTIAGLTFSVRMDRVDTLASGKKLLIDYKSGSDGPTAWASERPDNVQLPLYATFAVNSDLEGLLFGRVRPHDPDFCGRLRDASASLRLGLSPQSALVKNPLTDQQLSYWREVIERLGEEFLAGRAEVDPKDGTKTCDSCHLQAVCRIYEQPAVPISDDTQDAEGSDA